MIAFLATKKMALALEMVPLWRCLNMPVDRKAQKIGKPHETILLEALDYFDKTKEEVIFDWG